MSDLALRMMSRDRLREGGPEVLRLLETNLTHDRHSLDATASTSPSSNEVLGTMWEVLAACGLLDEVTCGTNELRALRANILKRATSISDAVWERCIDELSLPAPSLMGADDGRADEGLLLGALQIAGIAMALPERVGDRLRDWLDHLEMNITGSAVACSVLAERGETLMNQLDLDEPHLGMALLKHLTATEGARDEPLPHAEWRALIARSKEQLEQRSRDRPRAPRDAIVDRLTNYAHYLEGASQSLEGASQAVFVEKLQARARELATPPVQLAASSSPEPVEMFTAHRQVHEWEDEGVLYVICRDDELLLVFEGQHEKAPHRLRLDDEELIEQQIPAPVDLGEGHCFRAWRLPDAPGIGKIEIDMGDGSSRIEVALRA